MSLRTLVSKYEPMDANLYIGGFGEVWVDNETAKLHLGNDTTPGGVTPLVTSANGVNDMGGNLWIGTVADNDSVMWAGEDAEYAALWWGGNRDIENPGYGPYAHFGIGSEGADDMVAAPMGTIATIKIGEDSSWTFDGDTGSFIVERSDAQIVAQPSSAGGSTGGYTFYNDGGLDTGMFSSGDGVIQFMSNTHDALTVANMSTTDRADWTVHGTMRLIVYNSAPAGVAGKMSVCDGTGWNGGGDGLQHLMIYINDAWTKVV